MIQTFLKAFYVKGPPNNASVFGVVWRSNSQWIVSWTFHYEDGLEKEWLHLAETSEEKANSHLRTVWHLFLQSRSNLGFSSYAQFDRMEEINIHPKNLPWGHPFQSFPVSLDKEQKVRQGTNFRSKILQN